MEQAAAVAEFDWPTLRGRLVAALRQELQAVAEKNPSDADFRPVGPAVVLREKSSGVSQVFSIDTKHRTVSDESLKDEPFLAADGKNGTRYPIEEVLHVLPSEVQVRAVVEAHDLGRVALFVRSDPTQILKRSIATLTDLPDAGLATAVSSRKLSAGRDSSFDARGLSTQQQAAVAASLASGVNVIWGPPGTGKTLTLGQLLAEIVSRGQSALLVSNTNVAVDEALLKTAATVVPNKPGILVRAGTPTVSVNLDGQPPMMLEDAAKAASQKLMDQLVVVEERIQRETDAIEHAESPHYQRYLDVVAQFPDRNAALTAVTTVAAWDAYQSLASRAAAAWDALTVTAADVEALAADQAQAGEALARVQKSHDARLRLAALQGEQNGLDAADSQARETHRVAARFVAEQQAAVSAAETLPWRHRRKELKNARALLAVRVNEQERAAAAAASTATHLAEFLDRVSKERDTLRTLASAYTETDHDEALETNRISQAALETATQLHHSRQQHCADLNTHATQACVPEPPSRIQKLAADLHDLNYSEAWTEVTRVKEAQSGFALRRTKLLEQRRALLESIQTQIPTIIRGCRLLATTTSTLLGTPAMAPALERKWDYVIVDESSACLIPFIIACATMATRGVTLVGDPLQNGPISMAAQKKSGRPPSPALTQDIFSFLGIRPEDVATSRPGVVFLDEQHRFPAEIAHVANAFAYGPEAITTRTKERTTYFTGLPQQPILLLDVSGLPEDLRRFHSPTGRKAGSWLAGAAVAAHLGRLAPAGASLGVVTVYSQQVKATREVLDGSGLTAVECGTSHRYQGREFDLVVFDTGEPLGANGWASAASFATEDSSWPYSGARLCNVAVTRAKSQLAVVVDMRVRTKSGTFLHVLKQAAAEGRACVINVADLLAGDTPVQPLSDSDVQSLLDAHRFQPDLPAAPEAVFLTERDVYRELPDLLAGARERVELWSAFVAKKRSRQVLPLLAETVGRGVPVTVYCKPVAEMSTSPYLNNEDMLAELRGAGVEVVERFGTHEKALLVDRTVGLFGSLNLLSHNDTSGKTEYMLRLTGSTHAKNFIALVTSR